MSRVRRLLRSEAVSRREGATARDPERGARPTGTLGRPTPIPISPRVALALAVVAFVLVGMVLYLAPVVLTVTIGGVALAIVLSFPVRALSRVMPRLLAIAVTFVGLFGTFALALTFLIPLLIDQLSNLIDVTPVIASQANEFLLDGLRWLNERDLLGGTTPDQFVQSLVDDLFDRAQALSENLLGSLVNFLSGAFSVGIAVFGVLFVAAYLLIDVRKFKAAYLRTIPRRYRRDALELWEAFGISLSRYLGGLVFVVVIEGALVGLMLYLLGVPYALLLGVWVAATAIIPYLGVFLGAIPAVAVALTFESSVFDSRTTTTILVVVLYVAIQQLEGNVLTPRIQGQALHVHPVVVLLAIIGGGELAGLVGVIFAVPTLAALSVLTSFFRTRLEIRRAGAER